MTNPALFTFAFVIGLWTLVVLAPDRFARRFPEADLLALLRAVGGKRDVATRLARLERTADPTVTNVVAIRRALARLRAERR